MGDEERGEMSGRGAGDKDRGGYSILLDGETVGRFMESGDFSSAREIDHFRDLAASVEKRLDAGEVRSIIALSIGEDRLSRDFAVLQTAHILAKHGKRVLIVDCDFLSPGMSGLVAETEQQGFLDLLLYGSSPGSVTRPTGIDGVSVVGPGSFPVSRTVPFALKEFEKISKFLGRSHDAVFYCSTLHTDDGSVNPLVPFADSVLLSCRIDDMPEGQLQGILQDLGPGRPHMDLVCFGEAGSEGARPVMEITEEEEKAPVATGDEPSIEPEPVEPEEEDEPAFIVKTEEVEGGGDRRRRGVDLPRLVTAVVVVFVIVFLGWWFLIHRSIREKEGDTRMTELVRKQQDAREMSGRTRAGDAPGRTAADSADVEPGAETPPTEEERAGELSPPGGVKDSGGAAERAGEPAKTARDVEEPGATPETVTPAPEGHHFSVHVASFAEIGRAGRETDYLEGMGFLATVAETEVNGKTWYRVYAGEYGTREEAAAARVELLSHKRIGYARIVTVKNR